MKQIQKFGVGFVIFFSWFLVAQTVYQSRFFIPVRTFIGRFTGGA